MSDLEWWAWLIIKPPSGDQKFEVELFNKCKQNEEDLKATSGVLLHVSVTVNPVRVGLVHSRVPTRLCSDCFHAQQPGHFSLVEECRGSALIGRELHSVSPQALLCHKEPAGVSPTRGFGTQRPNGSLLAPRWFCIA